MTQVLCANCALPIVGEDIGNREHVIPKSWFPDDTPDNIQRPTVPSHIKCNQKIGKDESLLFKLLAMSVPPNAPRGTGIADKAIRSLMPEAGKNVRDKKHRQHSRKRLRDRIISTINMTEEERSHGIRSYIGEMHEDEAILIEPELVYRVFAKIARCISSYVYNERAAPPAAKTITNFVTPEEFISDPLFLAHSEGRRFQFGHGISFLFWAKEERGVHVESVLLNLWGAHIIHLITHWDIPGKILLREPFFFSEPDDKFQS